MDYKHDPELTPLARSLRRDMTKEERRLWYCFLKNLRPRFLRQKVIDNYIVDFYCSEVKLVIELDGGQHYENTARAMMPGAAKRLNAEAFMSSEFRTVR